MNFGDNPELYYRHKAEEWEKVAYQMSNLIMEMVEGNTYAYDKAIKLVKKHFPKLYKSYE